jgi:hypothetical protein
LDGTTGKTAHGKAGVAFHEQGDLVAFDDFVDALLGVAHGVAPNGVDVE